MATQDLICLQKIKYFELLSKMELCGDYVAILSFSCMIVEQVYNSVQLGSIRKLLPWPCAQLNVTGFWKTDQIVTLGRALGLFHFIGPTNGYTRTLYTHSQCQHQAWSIGQLF